MASGTTFKEISKKRMASVPFVLAPSRERERIVSAIEEHFSRLDATDYVLSTALEQIETTRRSVLNTAFAGQLAVARRPE